MEDWAGVYKFLRLGVLALALVGIAIYLFWPSRKAKLEEPATRMLEEEDARAAIGTISPSSTTTTTLA